MSDIDYQNGFLCGMATRGLIISGEEYDPKVWNDGGVYDYFYIDFLRSVADFSLGMLKESFIIFDSVEIPITNFVKIDESIYKIFCDISDKVRGVTVINKATSIIKFSNGSKVPQFSTMFYVSGLSSIMRYAYAFDKTILDTSNLLMLTSESPVVENTCYHGVPSTEHCNLVLNESMSTSENAVISYWSV